MQYCLDDLEPHRAELSQLPELAPPPRESFTLFLVIGNMGNEIRKATWGGSTTDFTVDHQSPQKISTIFSSLLMQQREILGRALANKFSRKGFQG